MPNSRSAEKRLRQNIVRRDRNRSAKSALRTAIRKVREAAAAQDVAKADAELRVASKLLDQTAAKKVIHRNTASRLKSRLSARVKAAKTAQG
ncbi:MAG: 30S ribosomal protein S20 [Planctomycetales bacterium]|nr:30S ribosomal protein S20 [Planctomycetales bacterium]